MRYLLVILCSLLPAFMPMAIGASYNFVGTSVLSSGKWLKVRVDTTGVQEITYSQLRSAGFADPSKVAVYGYGGVRSASYAGVPDDLPPVPVVHTADKLLFYGEGVVRMSVGSDGSVSRVRNVHSRYGCYFITDSQPVLTASVSVPAQAATGHVIGSHKSCSLIEDDVECPSRGGTEFFGPDISAGSYVVSLNVVDLVTDGKVSVYYPYAVKNSMSSSINVTFPSDIAVSSYSPGRCTGIFSDDVTYYTRSSGSFLFQPSGSGRSHSVDIGFSPSNNPAFAAVDYITVSYDRKNNLEGISCIEMFMPTANNGDELRIDGWNDQCRLWAVNPNGNVAECEVDKDGVVGRCRLTGAADVKYYAFNPAMSQHKVTVEPEPVAPQNLHGTAVPDMLIVTSSALAGEATELAEIHRTCQNLDVAVVVHDEIFNEFCSGTPHPDAYRRLAQMYYDRDRNKFRYLLLYGGGRYDNREALSRDPAALLTYQCELPEYMNLSTTVYCSDAYFGMVASDPHSSAVYTSMCDVAVGRIPVNDSSQAHSVNSKILRYLTSQPRVPVFNNALIICDDKDRNSHLDQAEDVVRQINDATGGSVTCHKVYHALYQLDANNDASYGRQKIKNILQRGVGFLCYTGHTNGIYLTGHRIWGIGSMAETEVDYPPLVMWSTCDAYSFDRTRSDLSQGAVFMSGGGAMGAIGACRTSYQDYNGTLMRSVTDSLYSAGPGIALGEVFRRARNGVIATSGIIGDRKLAVNTLCYNYCGDPALPFYSPQYLISAEVGGGSLRTMDLNSLSGQIEVEPGKVADNFNGSVIISVYDSPYAKTTYPRGTDPVVSVTLDEELLAEMTVPVVNGRFNAAMFLPVSLRQGADMRVSLYATSADGAVRAAGAISGVPVVLSDRQPDAAYEDPVIETLYVGSPDFETVGSVPSDCSVHAVVRGGTAGIGMTRTSVGMEPSIRLDGSRSIRPAVSYADNGDMNLTAPLRDLSVGEHYVELQVADNVGNRSTRIVGFVVADNIAARLTADSPIVADQVLLSIEHELDADPVGRLVIEDASGNTVFSRDNATFPMTWNLTADNGDRVADGRYSAYVQFKKGNVSGCTPRLEIVVIDAPNQ